MQAKDVMTTSVVSITPLTTVLDIVALLLERGISGVPVLEGSRLVGMVSESDLLRRHEIGSDGAASPRAWWTRWVQRNPMPAEYVRSHGGRARDIMSRQVISVAEDTPLARIASLLDWHRIGRVPVLRGSHLVGIVSRADVVRAIAAKSRNLESLGAPTDDSIRERLIAELERQPWWHSQWSNVFVAGGIVSYRGLVESEAERQAARVAAENVSGVRGVEDRRIETTEWQAMV
jgi:CBS domain-containing protein